MIIPIFPLNSVVLPGGRIPLQLFERRYIDMLTRCLKEDRGFGIVLLEQAGQDTSQGAPFHPFGCYVRVVDFAPLEHGLLGITVQGESKVAVTRRWQQPDGLHMGEVMQLPVEPEQVTPRVHEDLVSVLRALCQHPSVRELELQIDYQDARQVGWRLTELLPLDIEDRQMLLEMDDPLERLEVLEGMIEALE